MPGVASYDVDILADRSIFAIRSKFGSSGAKAQKLKVYQKLVVRLNVESGKMEAMMKLVMTKMLTETKMIYRKTIYLQEMKILTKIWWLWDEKGLKNSCRLRKWKCQYLSILEWCVDRIGSRSKCGWYHYICHKFCQRNFQRSFVSSIWKKYFC